MGSHHKLRSRNAMIIRYAYLGQKPDFSPAPAT
jgi:hypothetical protein